jgi:hypothetical protein
MLRKWKMYGWESDKISTKEHLRKISERLSKVESILFDLVKETGHIVVMEELDSHYPEVKKAKVTKK